MQAWERVRQITDTAVPKLLTEEEQTWDAAGDVETGEDVHCKMLWYSHVPGSFAPESIMIAAVQSMENMGYTVVGADELITRGLKALEENDMIVLHQVSAELWRRIHSAEKNEKASSWRFQTIASFEEYKSEVAFSSYAYSETKELFRERLYAGWLAQIIGGAMGTAIEGYTTDAIRASFGEVTGYVRKPNTYNDDITYELAFLKAYEEKADAVSAADIALQWIGLVPMGWSAEEVALRNIRYGIFPPLSGAFCNPFREWIGAQMRGAVCGMVAPGDPEKAARLAWLDGSVSHSNNGIIGEVFNAILVSLSFVQQDMREILRETISMLPAKSEYYSVVNAAYQSALCHDNWEDAWRVCEASLKEYNWIHAYPNAAAEVIALYYGNGDFDETMHIIAMAGQDVDCNAAQIMTAIGILLGAEGIPEKWRAPIGDELDTYVRGMKKMSITALADWTLRCAASAAEHY
jgi:ADP-ribosylglycohydrolase